MKKLTVLVLLIAVCGVGVVFAADARRDAAAADTATELQMPTEQTQAALDADRPVPVAAGLTWKFVTRESCADLFLRSCSGSFPQPQCPANPAGQACAPRGAACYATINSATVDIYRCR